MKEDEGLLSLGDVNGDLPKEDSARKEAEEEEAFFAVVEFF